MPVSRQVRRAEERAKKKAAPAAAVGALGSLLAQFQEIANTGDGLSRLTEQIPQMMGMLESTQQMFVASIEENKEIRYELDRQRMVSLRLVSCVNPVDPSNVQEVLQLEQQFRDEYDALRLLQATLALLDDRDP